MNYTTWCRWLVGAAVVIAMAGLPALGQSPYVAASSTALPEASASTGSDSSDPILTIKKRVDEVNVLFIATDHHGKFVRNLNQVCEGLRLPSAHIPMAGADDARMPAY